MGRHLLTLSLLLSLFGTLGDAQVTRDWPVYGGDAGGTRFSPLARITRDNVATLVVAWRYQTGEPALDLARQPSLQVTPIVVDNMMYVSTPLGKVMALEPATGREIWRYDARVNPRGGFGDFANRKSVQIVRKTPTGNRTFRVNMENVLEKGKTEEDVTLEPEDFIIVPQRAINF